MKILVLGATGFVGNAIYKVLSPDYDVIAGSRSQKEANWRKVDFDAPLEFDILLKDIDLLINAVGIIKGDYAKIQTEIPKQIFNECLQRNIRIVNISALGAEEANPKLTFLASKKLADAVLLDSKLAKIIYPGVIIGRDGESTQFFKEMVSFPIVPFADIDSIPAVTIGQLVNLVKKIVEDFDSYPNQIIALAQPEPIEDLLSAIKGSKVHLLKTPNSILSFAFKIYPKLQIGVFNKDMFDMLNSISTNYYKPIFDKASADIDSTSLIKSYSLQSLILKIIIALLVIVFYFGCFRS